MTGTRIVKFESGRNKGRAAEAEIEIQREVLPSSLVELHFIGLTQPNLCSMSEK